MVAGHFGGSLYLDITNPMFNENITAFSPSSLAQVLHAALIMDIHRLLVVDRWMNGVLGHFYALSRLNWAGDNLG